MIFRVLYCCYPCVIVLLLYGCYSVVILLLSVCYRIVVLLLSVCYSVYIIFRKILSDDFALGFPTIVLGIGFSLGIIMFALGIIGEYLFQINLKTTKRPNYVVKKVF